MRMEEVCISVIVPVYNSESTLARCVDSILNQSFKNFELLLIDDGSSDESPQICDNYAKCDNRVRVFHKVNGGVSSARNVGLDNARGEWVAFVDSDDCISGQYLNGVVWHSGNLVVKGYKAVCVNKVVASKIFNEYSLSLDMSSFVNHNAADIILRSSWAKFYRKNVIGQLRFLEDMKVGEDLWFVLKYISKCKNIVVNGEGIYIMNVGEESHRKKYATSVDYAVKSLKYIKDAFNDLVENENIDKSFFLSYILYFKYLSRLDVQGNRAAWYRNADINSFYRYVWPYLSLKQKTRLLLSRMLKR